MIEALASNRAGQEPCIGSNKAIVAQSAINPCSVRRCSTVLNWLNHHRAGGGGATDGRTASVNATLA